MKDGRECVEACHLLVDANLSSQAVSVAHSRRKTLQHSRGASPTITKLADNSPERNASPLFLPSRIGFTEESHVSKLGAKSLRL